MKPIMKNNALIIFCLTMLSFSGCQDEGKDRLDPPEMMEEGKHDYISYSTDIVGEFNYYGETIIGDFIPKGFAGYKFTGKRDEVVSIELTAQTNDRDTVLYLYPPEDPSDSQCEKWRIPIAENDDIDWPENTNSAIVDFTLPYDGVYLVVVAEFYRRSGVFNVTLNCTGGGCVPVEPQSRCERLGGMCISLRGECRENFVSANESGQSLGCGGPGTVCCVPAEPNPYACESSSDCVMARADCCGCQNGGTSVAINRDFADMAAPDPFLCAHIMCLAYYNCFGVAHCIDGMCTTVPPGGPEAGCIDSGGSIDTAASCCEGVGNFPNTCGIDPCGCAPEHSHDISVCACPDGQCFDGYKCINHTEEPVGPEAGCIDSGGTITTASCCEGARDFPNMCLIGPCGCAPEYSHDVRFCACPDGQCFDGYECIYHW